MTKPITLVQVIQHYRGLPHQTAALYELQADLEANGYHIVMDRERPWFNTWSSAPPPKPPLQQEALPPKSAALAVPYFSQMDNPNTRADGPGWRQCASSSCAMLAAFWGKVTPDQAGEARYINLRQRHGATTDPMAHVASLRELGLLVEFRSNGSAEQLRRCIASGQPVAVGWFHHGPISQPSGGGHWSLLIGYDPQNWIHHDPYGEADLTNGGYISNAVGAGKAIRYSNSGWFPRWAPRLTDGWYITGRPV